MIYPKFKQNNNTIGIYAPSDGIVTIKSSNAKGSIKQELK